MPDLFLPVVEKIKFTKEDDLTEFHYEDDVLFDRPLVVQGTKKQYVPYPAIKRMQTLDEGSLATVVNSLQQVEDFGAIYLQSISKLEPVLVKEQGFMFQVKEELVDRTEEYNLFIPFNKSTVAFKRLSTMLGIPYKFATKNPGALNEDTFSVWKDKICEDKNKDLPLCIIYSKANTIDIEKEGKTWTCNLVMTLLPTGTIKKADGSVCLIKKDISDQIPVLHKIIPAFVDGIKLELPGTKVILHSLAEGFQGESKGNHYLKFLIDSPELKWKVDEDTYLPSISLLSNFTGEDKKGLGNIAIAIALFKPTCSNGAGVPMPEEHLEGVRTQFINKLMEVNRITPEHKAYAKSLVKYGKMFKKKFSDFGVSMPLHEFLTNFQKSDFITLLKIFISCKDKVIPETFESLKINFNTVQESDFVEAVEVLGKKHKLKSNLTQTLILEFLAGKRDGVEFKNPYQMVQYSTYFSQSFDPKQQIEAERRIIPFGKDLAQALNKKAHFKQETLEKYQKMITDEM